MTDQTDWSKCNVERLIKTLYKLVGEKEGLDIEVSVRKKTPEELARDRELELLKEQEGVNALTDGKTK